VKLFRDDTDQHVAGARDAGIHAVRYHGNAQAIEQIGQLLTAQ
jgi:hypothetical protein